MATMLDYFAHAQAQRRGAIWLWDLPGKPRLSAWRSDGRGNVTWVDGDEDLETEHWRVRDGWIMCDGFSPKSSTPPTKPSYKADACKAEIEDLASGQICELPAVVGHYYAPYLLPAGPWRMRNWARIAGESLMYWETDFYPGERARNNVWYQGSTELGVVRQREVWWDANGGWMRGSGTPPFDVAGRPVRPTVSKMFEVTLAPDIGVWTGHDLETGEKFGAGSVWPW